jgi:calcyphosin
LIKKAY